MDKWLNLIYCLFIKWFNIEHQHVVEWSGDVRYNCCEVCGKRFVDIGRSGEDYRYK